MRRSPRPFSIIVVGAALLAAALGAPASAQIPPCATLTLSHFAPTELEPRAEQRVTFTVVNEAQLAEVAVVVRTNIARPGWQVSPAEMPLRLAPGGTAEATFTVTAPATRGDEAVLNAVASGSCTVNGNPLPLPGLGTVPDATDSMPLVVASATGIVFPDLAELPAAYFIGGLGLVVVVLGAVLAARRRRGGFEVKSPEPEKAVRPGRGASFPLEVANRGRQPDTARFEVGDVPQGWSAFMAVPELTLAPGEARTLWLMVRAPETAEAGSGMVVPVVVRSKAHARLEARIAVRAEVQTGPDEPTGGVEATRMG